MKAPAGTISASDDAMAAFMVALLGDGAHGDARILEPATTGELLDRALAPDPRINGMTLGLYERSILGVRIVGHGGGTQRFFTDMALFSEDRLGVFVSFNSPGGSLLPSTGSGATFLDRYYPVPAFTLDAPPAGWAERAAEYQGRYRMVRRSTPPSRSCSAWSCRRPSRRATTAISWSAPPWARSGCGRWSADMLRHEFSQEAPEA